MVVIAAAMAGLIAGLAVAVWLTRVWNTQAVLAAAFRHDQRIECLHARQDYRFEQQLSRMLHVRINLTKIPAACRNPGRTP